MNVSRFTVVLILASAWIGACQVGIVYPPPPPSSYAFEGEAPLCCEFMDAGADRDAK